MANHLLRSLRKAPVTSILYLSPLKPLSFRWISHTRQSLNLPSTIIFPFNQWKSSWEFRKFSHGLVNLVISEGKPKFETHEIEPPKKEKWKTKKRFKMQRMREKVKRKSANKRDPRYLGVKGKKKKQKFPNAEERIKWKIEKAKIKEGLLIERLKRYEVRQLQGPVVEPQNLTGEERFYMKKMAQKRSNYVPVGRRGVFGGVILNMHLHWKKHETVKVICKPCKPGQVHQYAEDIARLSGGTPIQIIGNDTIIFYRGKDYVQPEVMSPIDTLSKKKALEKSKYEQSLESVRRFIAIAEKELELYYRHVALYGDPIDRSSYSASTRAIKGFAKPGNPDTYAKSINSSGDEFLTDLSHMESEDDSDCEDLGGPETELYYGSVQGSSVDSEGEENTSNLHESSASSRPV
ncbi:Crm-domain containing factor cfm2 protein [Thalictrum thalictroides]|uniref:Crm-domain containing factor cfm2 protein n=1 Tax=Thalictrum thalictroides TaxID=46969 RepID=A0A7J6WDH4_THATH|nr:Crm-domain containing factor cfm2 protein [Thalictrum thalictroides]